ncbi:MAG: hypothetical protein WC861_01220 [Candidatus Micrarchaeia archaeon]|jgi:RNase P/RNase MRP subunit p30
MRDIVLFQGQQTSAAEGMIFSGALPNFFPVQNALAAKQACRKKGALLHASGYEVDEGDLLELARAGGALVFSFSDLLSESGFRRAIIISKMRLALAACRRRGASFVFCSLAKNGNEARIARELMAFAAVLGATDVERKEAEKSIARLTGASAKPKKGLPAASAAQVEK